MKKSLQMGGVILASLLTATSCQNEAIVSENQQSNYMLNVSSFVGSRTHVEQDGTVKWSKGDKLYVYGQGVSGVLTLDDNDADKTDGKFSGFVFGNPQNLKWAVFGDDVKFTNDGAQFTIKEVTDPNSNSPMVGEIGSGSVQMEHLCGMVRLTINNLPQNATVTLGGTGIAGTAEVKNGAVTNFTPSNSITLKAVEGSDDVFEVPVFATTNEEVKSFTLTIGGVSCEFKAPIKVKSLSQDAIMEFTCVIDVDGNVVGFEKDAITPQSVAFALQQEGDVEVNIANDMTFDKSVVIGASTNATIKTNGKELSFENGITITNNGELTMMEDYSLFRSAIGCESNPYDGIVNNGDMYISCEWNGVGYSYSVDGLSKTVVITSNGGVSTANGILKNDPLSDNVPYDSNDNITSVEVEEGITTIGNRTFRRCYALESVTLPSTLTKIESGAFQSCRALSSVTIPNTVTVIGDYAFGECYALESINIPFGVKEIANDALRASGIKSIELPASVTNIGNQAFRDCYQLRTLTILSEEIEIGNNAFLWASNQDKTAKLTIRVMNEAVKAKVLAKTNQHEVVVMQ